MQGSVLKGKNNYMAYPNSDCNSGEVAERRGGGEKHGVEKSRSPFRVTECSRPG